MIGSKPLPRTKDVWSIRTKPQVEERTRHLAMFNLAIDSKHAVRLKVEDVPPHGMTVDRAMVHRRKTGHPPIGIERAVMTPLPLPGKSRSEVLEQRGLTLPIRDADSRQTP